MRHRPRSKATPHKHAPDRRPFTTAEVRLILSSPVYAYGINLQPAERVAEEVMKLNAQLAQIIRETGATFTLENLNHRFQALLLHLENNGICQRDVD